LGLPEKEPLADCEPTAGRPWIRDENGGGRESEKRSKEKEREKVKRTTEQGGPSLKEKYSPEIRLREERLGKIEF